MTLQDTSNLPLTPWQQKQAAMLAYFSSMDYLVGLQKLVTCIISGVVDPALDDSTNQNRDALLVSSRWGARNTSRNWSDYGWPFLKDLQASLAKDIASRGSGVYTMTAVNECLRGVEQFSLEWMTPGEQRIFTQAIQEINDWASPLDLTMANWMSSAWDDYCFAYYYPAFAARCHTAPRYRILTETAYPTGSVPPRTGIYISKDDPFAALQFASSGTSGIALRKASGFNDLGHAALAAVGRESLWFDDQKMFDFATSPAFAPILRDDVFWDGVACPDLARSAVARKALTLRDSDWYFVEPIAGEFDSLADLGTETPPFQERVRIVGGEKCIEAGFYFSPSYPNSRRYLSAGETAPIVDNGYGKTFWQWDLNQK